MASKNCDKLIAHTWAIVYADDFYPEKIVPIINEYLSLKFFAVKLSCRDRGRNLLEKTRLQIDLWIEYTNYHKWIICSSPMPFFCCP